MATRRVNDPAKIDPDGVKAVDALLGYLKSAGVNVFLAHPPFNPLYFQQVSVGSYVDGLRKVV